jgi:hypothetical protein
VVQFSGSTIAPGQHQQPLLQPHEQVIDLPGFGLGFVLPDFTNGKAVQFAVVAEQNSVAAVSLLQRCHDAALRSITPTSGKPLYQNFTKRLVKHKGQEARIRRNPLPCLQCRREDSNLHTLNGYQVLNLARLPIPPLRLSRSYYSRSRFPVKVPVDCSKWNHYLRGVFSLSSELRQQVRQPSPPMKAAKYANARAWRSSVRRGHRSGCFRSTRYCLLFARATAQCNPAHLCPEHR